MPSLLKSNSYYLIVAGVCVVGLLGCGNSGQLETAPVKGRVMYLGFPIHVGSLLFVPTAGGPSAQGMIDKDGNYVMGTYDETDGVPPGEYKVMITAFTAPGGEGLPEDAADGNAGVVSIVPERYGDLDKSGLVVNVKAGVDNTFDFDLKDEVPNDDEPLE